MSESRTDLKTEFLDEEYRYAYAEDFLNTLIATQIRVLRDQRDLTQEQFAVLIGTKQAGVSRLENVNHSSWKTDTLKKIARAFNVRLKITFEDFTTLLEDAENFCRENLQRVSFERDATFYPRHFRSRRYHRKSGVRRSPKHGGVNNFQLPFKFDGAGGGNVIEMPLTGAARATMQAVSATAGAGGNYGSQAIA